MKTALRATLGLVLLAVGSAMGAEGSSQSTPQRKVRRFELEYGATFAKLPAGKRVRLWLPVPPSNDYQKVREVSRVVPGNAKEMVEHKYGNRMLYCETQAPPSGEVTVKMVWDVERKEVRNLEQPSPVSLSAEERKKFLSPDRKVPVGDPKPLALLGERPLPAEPIKLARVLYDCVDEHVKYDKSKPGYGFGDVQWVCDSRFGNCTDFHSLFISLARSKGLPAFFGIGFPLPPDKKEGEIGGYHCWAMFHTDSHGWVPVDISEADKDPKMKEYYFGNLTADRVTFTVGRDIDLVPKQDGDPLNYFIYPHVEVDGKPQTEMQRRFYFKDK